MRRYMQGTLDYACAVYAVINAVSALHGIELTPARSMFRESQLAFSERPALWRHFLQNDTDHYWVVRYMLRRWCLRGDGRAFESKIRTGIRFSSFLRKKTAPLSPPSLHFPISGLRQPFADWMQGQTAREAPVKPDTAHAAPDEELDQAAMFLPEEHAPCGPLSRAEARGQALEVWRELEDWFAAAGPRKAALLRFHRFLPGVEQPVVSHWTCVRGLSPWREGGREKGVVHLLDASSEQGALHELERDALIVAGSGRALLRIVPESLLLLRA
ncbi:hypothetical protein LJC59_02440 [Desulfovibrio sp. OttesenSCG-928-A18]|nr:hypothetical protein [Desulfovibrio sp. OttesenSCG-928-A18]